MSNLNLEVDLTENGLEFRDIPDEFANKFWNLLKSSGLYGEPFEDPYFASLNENLSKYGLNWKFKNLIEDKFHITGFKKSYTLEGFVYGIYECYAVVLLEDTSSVVVDYNNALIRCNMQIHIFGDKDYDLLVNKFKGFEIIKSPEDFLLSRVFPIAYKNN